VYFVQLRIVTHCPPNTLFCTDQCRDTNDGESLLSVSYRTKFWIPTLCWSVVKRCQGQAVFETCPPGFRYIDSPTCESEACVGQPNHQLVPLPKVQQGPLTYFPGYMQCQDNKVANVVVCPDSWDPYSSAGDNLTHLPQVFDGRFCTIPEFCTNVESDDPLVTVPVHEFTKHVRNWKYSDRFDAVTGIQCQGNKRKRVSMSPGERIHSKRLKPESACDGTVSKVVISNTPESYFDCNTQTVEACAPKHFFDGVDCHRLIENSHTFNGIGLFQLDSLRIDNWMGAWDYSKTPSAQPCTDPESEYLETYNVCSHPDCTMYPFLTQIPFSVKLKGGSQCTFRSTDRRLVKQPTTLPILFWAQREVEQEPTDEPCEPAHEVKNLYPTAPPPNRVGINKIYTDVPQTGLCPTSGFQLETLDQSVAVEYAHRVTYPPDVVWNEDGGKVSRLGGGYLVKLQDFTEKPINLPMHNIKYAVSDFALNRKP
ncbi:uncharacterized protein NPIL_16861, partial [Nephila pilipes]